MKNYQFLLVLIFLIIPAFNLLGQENKQKSLTYSFSYIPPYLYSFEGEFEFVPLYANFEGNVNLKPFRRISFTTGLGYLLRTEKHYTSQTYTEENDSHIKITESSIRIPIQTNYHLKKSPEKTDWYLKAVYTNGFFFSKYRDFEYGEIINTTTSSSYIPSIGLGIGSIFMKDKPVGIIIEGMIETYEIQEFFTGANLYSLKIGVVL